MHFWGEWPDESFSQVANAADYIGNFCVKWGRIPVRQTKEKFGTVRVYSGWGIENLFWLVKPNYVYYQWGKKFHHIDNFIFGNLFKLFRTPIFHWQTFIYRLAYKNALKKWPNIREEILCSADWDEYLKGL